MFKFTYRHTEKDRFYMCSVVGIKNFLTENYSSFRARRDNMCFSNYDKVDQEFRIRILIILDIC